MFYVQAIANVLLTSFSADTCRSATLLNNLIVYIVQLSIEDITLTLPFKATNFMTKRNSEIDQNIT